MGEITDLIADKTGTITENKLRVSRVWLNKDMTFNHAPSHRIDPAAAFHKAVWPLLEMSIACNVPKNRGPTDQGLVEFIEKCGSNIEETKRHYGVYNEDEVTCFEFSSRRKRRSTIIKVESTGDRLLCKGASELILSECSHIIDAEGNR